MDHLTIIATSLNADSKSQHLAEQFEGLVQAEGIPVERIDLRTLEMPFAGSPGGWEAPDVIRLEKAVSRASHVVFAVPIYCYDVNAAAKNVIELVGRSFTKKVVGFICSAGGQGSYMSVIGLANHLMLDFRSVIVPRFLYVSKQSWEAEGALDAEITDRMHLLFRDLQEVQVISEEEKP